MYPISSDVSNGLENVKEEPSIEGKNIFPKKVGIIFIERLRQKRSLLKGLTEEGTNPRLNFDQVACAHFVLQMNTIQGIFDFQIVIPKFIKEFSFRLLPTEDDNHKNSTVLDWLDDEVKIILENSERKKEHDINYLPDLDYLYGVDYLYGIDYWIGISSMPILHDWFFQGRAKEHTKSGRYIGIITSVDWEKVLSPPSLFEYIAMSILTYSLCFINLEFHGELYFHTKLITKGCIFDSTEFKAHRRINVSNPHLCGTCKEQLRKLDTKIFKETASKIHIYDDVHKILSRKWMGDPKKRDSPLYNLNKNYKYNVDRHSGFYKTPWERFRDILARNG